MKSNASSKDASGSNELRPEFEAWQDVLNALEVANQMDSTELLLLALLTPDEREALVSRLNILHELLEGRYSQRQISQMLQVGVATITRGSTELKKASDEQKAQLQKIFSQTLQK